MSDIFEWQKNNSPLKPEWLLPVIMSLILLIITSARADDYTDEQIVDAIYIIEGGSRAQFAYGIRSIKYSTIVEARKICFNTVRKNRKRYADYGYKQYPDYLSFLQFRYCPTRGKLSKAEQKLNGHWLLNLRKQLAKKWRK